MAEELLVETADYITTITINRAHARNSMNAAVTKGLTAVLEELARQDETRVVVLRGAGKEAFCAGHDLKELLAKGEALEGHIDEATRSGKLQERLTNYPKPTIALVHGFCVGGGCWLARSCDLVYASDDAIFGLPQPGFGVFPMVPMVLLMRHIGRAKFMELVLTGVRLNAQEAKAVNLVNQVVPKDQLETHVYEIARKITTYSPVVTRMGKQAAAMAWDMEYDKAIAALTNFMGVMFDTEDSKEGRRALKEKRQPVWPER